MKKYEKLLRKLNGKSRDLVIGTIDRLIAGNIEGLDIVKLKENMYRARVGNYRIFFHYEKGATVVDDIRRRNEQTYRDV